MEITKEELKEQIAETVREEISVTHNGVWMKTQMYEAKTKRIEVLTDLYLKTNNVFTVEDVLNRIEDE